VGGGKLVLPADLVIEQGQTARTELVSKKRVSLAAHPWIMNEVRKKRIEVTGVMEKGGNIDSA